VSRYGLIALASSLDQAAPVARTGEEAALLHQLIAGHDPLDSTSLPDAIGAYAGAAHRKGRPGMRIGVISELEGEGFDPEVRARFTESLAQLEQAGAEIVPISCPNFRYALGAYYLVMPSEASSNLAKFDGMRFGLRVVPEDSPTAESVMKA